MVCFYHKQSTLQFVKTELLEKEKGYDSPYEDDTDRTTPHPCQRTSKLKDMGSIDSQSDAELAADFSLAC
jgi:hypothetical protein